VPTILIVGPYRFFFYSSDRLEPAHVHIDRDDLVAKLWLHDMSFARHNGFSAAELRRILGIARDNEAKLKEGWNAHFSR
jgi:Domain of unknown function (DUF4160)